MSNQQINPAPGSNKIMSGKEKMQKQALVNAVSGTSDANYDLILGGFVAKGIPEEEIIPRENVFTFNAWRALGRTVRKGEKGVPVFTVIPCKVKDNETDEEIQVKKRRKTTVFHVSQTEALN